MNMAIVDATGHVVGRLASVLAKRLLNGEEIVVVNADIPRPTRTCRPTAWAATGTCRR